MNLQTITMDDFRRCYGSPDTSRAVHSFTKPVDTQLVLALLVHSRARRIVEIGTALGHMTANLTEWSPDDALIFTIGTVADLSIATAQPQRYENPSRAAFGCFANHFGKAHKIMFVTADSLTYDFHPLAPIDFVFIDGAHDREHVQSDTLKIYRELSPTGCIAWHDFNSATPWVEVRKALEQLDFVETVYHVAGTEVAFLDRQVPDKLRQGSIEGFTSTVHNRVSLCLIVRNEESHLSACLTSVADLVHEIILVDTGSTDRTKEIAEQFGAKIVDFAWIDDFAAARNESIRHATGDWIFWLDADERLDDANRERLRALLASLGDENAAYTMTQRSELEAATYSAAMVDHVRLFRNHPEIRWEYRVHEQILPAVRRTGGVLRQTDIVIEHAGFQDPALQEPKVERNLRLLRLEMREHPDDPFVLFNLGSVYLSRGQAEAALPLLRRSLELSETDDTIVRKLYVLLTRAHHQLGQRAEALATCRAGLALFAKEAELLFWEGMLLREQGELAAAQACLLQVLQTGQGTNFTGVDAGMTGYKARHCLAEIYRDQGRLAEAGVQWQAVLAERPHFAPARVGLAEVYASQSKWAEVEETVGSLQADPHLAGEVAVLRARARMGQGDLASAREILEESLGHAPDAIRPRILLTHVLLQEGKDWEAAETVLRDVVKRDPRQGESWRNLASLMRQQKRTAESFAACEAGRMYCPEYSELSLIEGQVLLQRGDGEGAEACLGQLVDGTTSPAQLMPIWLELGHLYLSQQRWGNLDRVAEKLQILAPGSGEAELLRAQGLMGRGEFESAREVLKPLIAAAPQAIRPKVALSYAYLQEGKDWLAAERALRDVLAIDPANEEARHNLELALEQRG